MGQVVTVAEGEYVAPVRGPGPGLAWRAVRRFDVPAGSMTRDSAFMFRVHDGLITDRWAIRDDLAMMVQLGALQAPRPEQVPHGTMTSGREQPFDSDAHPPA